MICNHCKKDCTNIKSTTCLNCSKVYCYTCLDYSTDPPKCYICCLPERAVLDLNKQTLAFYSGSDLVTFINVGDIQGADPRDYWNSVHLGYKTYDVNLGVGHFEDASAPLYVAPFCSLYLLDFEQYIMTEKMISLKFEVILETKIAGSKERKFKLTKTTDLRNQAQALQNLIEKRENVITKLLENLDHWDNVSIRVEAITKNIRNKADRLDEVNQELEIRTNELESLLKKGNTFMFNMPSGGYVVRQIKSDTHVGDFTPNFLYSEIRVSERGISTSQGSAVYREDSGEFDHQIDSDVFDTLEYRFKSYSQLCLNICKDVSVISK